MAVAITMNGSTVNETALIEQPRSGFLALAGMDFAEIMTEELDSLATTFERIKVPGAGSCSRCQARTMNLNPTMSLRW
ncbi:MAG: hypothetical protein LBS11_00700 [Oscillospiraceae bacterium]|nr:hypothetical protein [Oscillospiraceae bacterium]